MHFNSCALSPTRTFFRNITTKKTEPTRTTHFFVPFQAKDFASNLRHTLSKETNIYLYFRKMRFISTVILALSTVTTSPSCSACSPSRFNGRNSIATAMANPEKSVFLTPETAKKCIDAAGGSPVYAYSLEKLSENAEACLAFPNAYGLTVRYAMKACPNSSILKLFNSKNIHIDASSGFEVKRAIDAGIPADHISLSTQELPSNFPDLVEMGVKINAW